MYVENCPEMLVRRATFVWLALACAYALGAAEVVTLEDAGYQLRHWGVDEGLPGQDVNAVVQDGEGYLWIATNRGLARFDGIDFEHFALTDFYKKGLIPSFITLFCDSGGRLWIAEKLGSLILYEQGKFQLIRRETDEVWPIYHMAEDPEGTLWFSGRGHLACFRDGRLQPAPVRLPEHTDLTGMGFSEEGQLLFSNREGAYLLQIDKLQRESAVPTRVGLALSRGPYRTLNILTKEGVCRLEESKPVVEQHFQRIPRQDHALVGQDALGVLWYFNFGKNKIDVSIEESGGRNLQLNFKSPGQKSMLSVAIANFSDALTGKNKPSIAFLEDNSVWLGTSNGLFQFRPKLFRQPDELQRLTGGLSFVSRIREDAAERLWFVINHNSFCLDKDRAQLVKTSIPGAFAWTERPGDTEIPILISGSFGWLTEGESVWQANGIWASNWRLNQSDGKWKRRREVSLPATATCFHLTSGGDLWVGTSGGPCLHSSDGFTLEGPEVEVVAMASDPSDRVYALFADESLRWSEDGRWQKISDCPTQKINDFCVDEHGSLWVTGEDNALARWNDGHWFSFDGQGIDWLQYTFGILADDTGSLWLSTPNIGVLWLDRRALDTVAAGKEVQVEHKIFDIRDGLPTGVCTEGKEGMTQTRRGELWVTTKRGPAVIDLDALQITRNIDPPQPVLIKEVRVDDIPVEVKGRTDGGPESGYSEIELRPGQQRIDFSFSAPNFSEPEKTRFRCRLDGLDLDWVNCGTARSTYYRDLPPGRYRLRFAATNAYGVWNDGKTSIEVVVLPAWWQRRSIQGAGVVIALAGVCLAGWFVLRGVRRRSEDQELFAQGLISSQERERQRIAAELHDSLGQDLILIKQALDIRNLDADFSEKGGDPQKPSLSKVANLAGHAIDQIRTITEDLSPPELSSIGLNAAVEEMVTRASDHASIEIRCRIADLDRGWTDDESINIYRIIQECLTNAIKHAKAQSIVVSAKRSLDTLLVEVKDDGVGYKAEIEPESNQGAGYGLVGLKKRALILGGNFLIQGRPDKGTSCKLELPLRRR